MRRGSSTMALKKKRDKDFKGVATKQASKKYEQNRKGESTPTKTTTKKLSAK